MQNVVNMPGGLDDYMEFLQEYCDQSGRDIHSVAIKPMEEWIKTKEFIDKGDAGAERIEAEAFLKRSRAIIDGLKKSTPLKSQLEILYEKLLEQPKRSHAVVFPNTLMKAFADWMINNRIKNVSNANSNGDTELVFFNSSQALDLSSMGLLNEFANVYFVLPRRKCLSQMITRKEMPSEITFICDGGTVLSLLHYVDILKKIPGLGVIKPRLTGIHEALQKAAGNQIAILGELDEVKLMSNAFIYNLREL
jgi:hypothetical protein